MSSDIKVSVVPFETIFSDRFVYECPFFQRPYKWDKKNIRKLVSDLVDLEVDDDDSVEHYLGAIVVRRDEEAPDGLQDPIVWTVIDGQQRLTTTFLLVLTLCEMLHQAGIASGDEGLREKAAAYVEKYLMLDPTWPQRGREPRVLPTVRDYSDLLMSLGQSRGRAGVPDEAPDRFRFKAAFVDALGEPNGPFARAYGTEIPAALRAETGLGASADDAVALERALTNLLRRMKVIWVQVPPGADPYEIFHNLNSEGQRLTHGELVKVAVFQRFSRAELDVAMASEADWNELQELIGGHDAFEAFLFPYALCHDPQAKKRELIPALEKIWKGMTPLQIIEDLQEYAELYDVIVGSGEDLDPLVTDAELRERIRSMRAASPPSPVFSYLMLTLRRALSDARFLEEAARIFWAVESFLVRRQFQGIEPTGLHALFKSLWWWEEAGVTGQTAAGFKARVTGNVNIVWIDDYAFQVSVEENALYGRRIQRFVLSEFERAQFGDISENALDAMEIDHVAPQKLGKTGWASVFKDKAEYASLVDTWGNLVPLTKTGDVSNSAKGRKDWVDTRHIFAHSVFQTPKQLCAEPAWDAHAIRRRNQALAAWALRRWPDIPQGPLPSTPKDIPAIATSHGKKATEVPSDVYLDPAKPYSNDSALRGLIASLKGNVFWWEAHMPARKVLDLLHESLDGEAVHGLRLMSGPDNATDEESKRRINRFTEEMGAHGITVEWRIVPKKKTGALHARVLSDASRTFELPPINSILQGTTDSIRESGIPLSPFEAAWATATPVAAFQRPEPPAK
jgi:hypothetical protein